MGIKKIGFNIRQMLVFGQKPNLVETALSFRHSQCWLSIESLLELLYICLSISSRDFRGWKPIENTEPNAHLKFLDHVMWKSSLFYFIIFWFREEWKRDNSIQDVFIIFTSGHITNLDCAWSPAAFSVHDTLIE